jgi:hypothetical protein
MPRKSESPADADLRSTLAEEGFSLSRYQLERWRHLGVLPRATLAREQFGGCTVLPHGQETVEAARLLAEFSQRGRPWQVGGVALFSSGFTLSQSCLQSCSTWLIDRVQRRLRSYWEEAAALATLDHDEPDDRMHEIAEIAVSIMTRQRAMRPVMRMIRHEVYAQVPRGTLQERREALHTALIYRVLDVARPGSLTKDEEYLAITGQDSPDLNITPMTPSDIARVAATLTVREAEIARVWLGAAWNANVLPMRQDTSVLEDVLLMVAELRLTADEHDPDLPLSHETLTDLAEHADELDRDYADGLIPGQLELELQDNSPS